MNKLYCAVSHTSVLLRTNTSAHPAEKPANNYNQEASHNLPPVIQSDFSEHTVPADPRTSTTCWYLVMRSWRWYEPRLAQQNVIWSLRCSYVCMSLWPICFKLPRVLQYLSWLLTCNNCLALCLLVAAVTDTSKMSVTSITLMVFCHLAFGWNVSQ